jgi:hypothetical protein
MRRIRMTVGKFLQMVAEQDIPHDTRIFQTGVGDHEARELDFCLDVVVGSKLFPGQYWEFFGEENLCNETDEYMIPAVVAT